MNDKEILAHLDSAGLVGIQIMAACFVAFLVVASFVFAVAIAAFVAGWLITRKALTFVLSRRQTGAVFAMLGG